MTQRSEAILERGDIRDDMPLEEQYIALSVLNCERLPMMDLIFERFALSLASAFQALSTSHIAVTLSEVGYTPYGNAIDKAGAEPFIAIAAAEKWGGRLAVVLDRGVVFPALEVMFGGGKAATPVREGKTGYTRIERSFAEQLGRIVLREFAAGFDQIDRVSFDIERTEVNAQLVSLARAISPTVFARFDVEIGDHTGHFDLIVPHATLDPIRKNLLQVFFGDSFAADETWRSHLQSRVQATPVELRAIYKEVSLPMSEVLAWQAGTTLQFYVAPDHKASLVCDGMELFHGDVGHLDDMRMAVLIDHDTAAAPGGDTAPGRVAATQNTEPRGGDRAAADPGETG